MKRNITSDREKISQRLSEHDGYIAGTRESSIYSSGVDLYTTVCGAGCLCCESSVQFYHNQDAKLKLQEAVIKLSFRNCSTIWYCHTLLPSFSISIQIRGCPEELQNSVSHTWGEPGAPSTQEINKLVIICFWVPEPAFQRPFTCSLQCWLLVT